MKNEVLAIYTICNNASLEIVELNEIEEYARIALVTSDVEFTPRKHKIYYSGKGAYINYKNTRIYLDEFMRSF